MGTQDDIHKTTFACTSDICRTIFSRLYIQSGKCEALSCYTQRASNNGSLVRIYFSPLKTTYADGACAAST